MKNYILDEAESEENETFQDIDDANYKEDFKAVNLAADTKYYVEETIVNGEIIGDIGKSPVYLKCKVCVQYSILPLT